MSTGPDEVVAALVERGLTLATAESLTGGGLGERVTAVPGASTVYLGGVVSYATAVKQSLLAVPAELVAQYGVVSAECARAMAAGVRDLLGADVGVSTTGVAGPDRQEGKPVGLAYVAVATDAGARAVEVRCEGDRAAIRAQACAAALEAVLVTLRGIPQREVSPGG